MTYEDDDTANRAIATYNGEHLSVQFVPFIFLFIFLDQHIDSLDSVVRVQLAQRRNRSDNDRGGRGGGMPDFLFLCTCIRFHVNRLSRWAKQLGLSSRFQFWRW